MSDDTIDFEDTTPEGMKSLRKAYEKRTQELAEERKNSATLASRLRTHDVAAKLKDLGAKPGLAEFVREDVEIENLGVWLAEKADLFGFKYEPPAENPANAVEAAAQSRVSEVTQLPGDNSGDEADLAAIRGTKSAEELTQLILDAQMGRR